MKPSSSIRAALLALMSAGLAACSTAPWQQLFYDVGDNYACQQAGTHLGDAKARASQCTDTQHPDRTRYQDYKAAREQAVKAQP